MTTWRPPARSVNRRGTVGSAAAAIECAWQHANSQDTAPRRLPIRGHTADRADPDPTRRRCSCRSEAIVRTGTPVINGAPINRPLTGFDSQPRQGPLGSCRTCYAPRTDPERHYA